jgi:transposase InsO family protein
VDLDIRESIIETVERFTKTRIIKHNWLLELIGISRNKYCGWFGRRGKINHHNGKIPRCHWITPEEKEAIVSYVKENYPKNSMFLKQGYRRISYEMLDENVAAVSPSSVYRVLKNEGLLNRWNTKKKSSKGEGFKQPDKPHEQWHTDIKYVNYRGTYLFFIGVLDGYSRYMLEHDVRLSMQEYDIELTVQKAREKYPDENPRLISDNGPQYLAKDFGNYLKEVGLQHTKTSVGYPQSNGKIERYFRSMDEECLDVNSFLSIEDARRIIAKYVDYYNTKRLHSALYYLTPEDYLKGRVERKLKEREHKIQTAIEKRYLYWSNEMQPEPVLSVGFA